jgi:hypothetical protein
LAGTCLSTLEHLGIAAFPISPEELIKAAQRQTGLENLQLSTQQQLALAKLCFSANHEAMLHPLGRIGIRDILVTALANRQLLQHMKEQYPERFNTPVRSPLMVIGLPRTGTTLLHRLLALAHDARPLRTFEVQYPLPPHRGSDNRKRRTRKQLSDMHKMAPGMALKHPIGANDAEEDFWLLNPSLLSATFFLFAPMPSYETWWQQQDMHDSYGLWAQLLSHFQHASPDRRWVLKSPAHTAFVEEMYCTVPDIQLVQIHRDPVEIVASTNSLPHTLYTVVSNWRDPIVLGRNSLDRLRWVCSRNTEARANGDTRIVDVRYDDLMNEPVATVGHICEELGETFSSEHQLRIVHFLEKCPRHQHGKHHYSLEECGLSVEDVDLALGRYCAPFLGS